MYKLIYMSYNVGVMKYELWIKNYNVWVMDMNYEYKLLIKKSELGICTNLSFSLMLVYICFKFVLFEELCALYRIMLFI